MSPIHTSKSLRFVRFILTVVQLRSSCFAAMKAAMLDGSFFAPVSPESFSQDRMLQAIYESIAYAADSKLEFVCVYIYICYTFLKANDKELEA